MFEARFSQGGLLKKILDSIRDLLRHATWDCGDRGMQLQCMDTSHVSLVSIFLSSEGFATYKCNKDVSMGMDLDSMAKVLRCSSKDDTVTVKAKDEEPDSVTFVFESSNSGKVSEYEMRLMNIEDENLTIPDTEYMATVKMPSIEFQRIVKDLSQFGEALVITCTKQEIQFSVKGDLGSGNVRYGQISTPFPLLSTKEKDF